MTGNIKEISPIYYIIKLMGTVSIVLTMLVVFLYLGRIAEGGLLSLLQNSNLFFHLLIPLLSLITFILFEKTNKIKFNYIVCGLIPMLIYGTGYLINIMYHIEDGLISPKYDWYYFTQNGIVMAYYVAVGLILFTYIIGIIIWVLNRCKLELK